MRQPNDLPLVFVLMLRAWLGVYVQYLGSTYIFVGTAGEPCFLWPCRHGAQPDPSLERAGTKTLAKCFRGGGFIPLTLFLERF